MSPLVVAVPLAIVTSGLAMFFLLPLEAGPRALILVSDLLAAALVGWLLWRRGQG
jgi:hypothetical protein